VADEVGRAGGAFVDLEPRLAEGFEKKVADDLDKPLSSIGARASDVGGKLSKGLTLPIVGAVTVIGGAIGVMGAQLDDAYDNIAVKTGATGQLADQLSESFRNVAARVPDDFAAVSDAIAELHQRTGLVGPGLEGLATQVLTLSRITGKDLSSTIEQSTRLFGDWSVATDDQAGVLDRLFAISQKTGVGVDAISTALVQFGGPLRQLGFTMDESAAMIAKFQKEGVNTELVLGSMRVALGKMARAGEAPAETLRRVMDEIKNAGDAGKANAAALELFGARAGPDMAAAIREGRFEVDGLISSLGKTDGAIANSAAATDGWAETWDRLKNRVILAVEPLATKLFAALDQLVPKLEPVINALVAMIDGLVSLDPKWQLVIVGVVAFLAAIGPVLSIVGAISAALPVLGAALASPLAPILAIAAAAVLAYMKFEGFREVVDAVVSWLVETVPPLVEQFVAYIGEQFDHLLAWTREVWPQVQEAIGHVMRVVQEVVGVAVDWIAAVWRAWGDDLLSIARTMFDYIKATVENAITYVRNVIAFWVAIINGDWGRAWEAIKGAFGAVWDQIKNIVSTAIDVVKSVIGGFVSSIGVVWSGVWDKLKGIVSGAWDTIKTTVSGGVEEVRSFIAGMPSKIAAAASGMWDGITNAFKSAINTIIRGWNRLEFKVPGFSVGPVSFGGFTLGMPNIPELAEGGIVSARPGGTLARIAEAGQDEVVAPLPDLVAIFRKAGGAGSSTGGPLVEASLTVDGNVYGDNHLRAILDEWSDDLASRLLTATRAGAARG
jgi:TP901 family phage tail tape measure protein